MRLLFISLIVFSFVYCQNPITTIFIVRHAEKMSKAADPALTEAGMQQAEQIKYLLKDAEIAGIYSSNFIRTRDTAAPLAKLLNLEIQIYDHRSTQPLVEAVMKSHGGKTILVVGHSNTVNRLAAAFGGVDFGSLDESIYTNLYQLSVQSVNDKLFAKMTVLNTLNQKL